MLRVPGPRPYEEVQSMLEIIRRQLFQSDILLKVADANESTPFPADSIKLEAKDEVEEVDPFQNMTHSTSVSPLLAQADEFGDTELEEVKEMDTESTTDLPSENVPSEFLKPEDSDDAHEESSTDLPPENVPSNFISRVRHKYFPHKRKPQDSDESDKESTIDLAIQLFSSHGQTYIPVKRKCQDTDESDEEPTTDLPLENVSIQLSLSHGHTYFQHKRTPHDTDESDEESTTDLPLENVPIQLSLSHRQTDFPNKRKLQDTDESDEEPTTDLPLENVPIQLSLSHGHTYFQHKRKPHDTDESDEESTTDLPLENVPTKPTCSRAPHKRKPQDVEESSTDLPSENVPSNSTSRVLRTNFSHKSPKKYSIQHIENKIPKVVLSRIPLELLNQQKLIESDKFRSGVANMSNVASTDNVRSDEQSGALLVTPEYLGLSESDLLQLFNIEVQGQSPKRIFIHVDNSDAHSQLLQHTKEKLP